MSGNPDFGDYLPETSDGDGVSDEVVVERLAGDPAQADPPEQSASDLAGSLDEDEALGLAVDEQHAARRERRRRA